VARYSTTALLVLLAASGASARPVAYLTACESLVAMDGEQRVFRRQVGFQLSHLAVAPDGGRLYILDLGEGGEEAAGSGLVVVDVSSRRVVAHVPIDGFLGRLVAHPDGTRVYVTSYEPRGGPDARIPTDARISVVDTATWTVAGSIALPDLAYGLALDAAGTRLYAASTKPFPFPEDMSGTLTAIDTRTNLVVATAPAPSGSASVALHPDGLRGYASAQGKLAVFDTATLDVTTTVEVLHAGDFVVHPSGSEVYVVNRCRGRDPNPNCPSSRGGAVTIVDAETNRVTAKVGIGHQPNRLAVAPGGQALWVTHGADNGKNPFVTVIQLGRAPHETTRLPMGRIPSPRRALTNACRWASGIAFRR
jgi:YVTN family beta-propeller protein